MKVLGKNWTLYPRNIWVQSLEKNRENLNKIEQKTGATLMVRERNGLYVKRSPESQKRAIREIKEQVVSLAMKVTRKAAVYRAGPSLYLVYIL